MNSSFLMDVTKDLLPILSGILGVLGVFNVFKAANNKLTLWGWLAIVVIIFSSVGSYYLSKEERADSDREKQQLQDKLNGIILDLTKVKQPIGDVTLSYWTLLSDSSPEVMEYKKYIKGKIKIRADDSIFSNPPKVNNDLRATILDVNGMPAIFEIDKKSKFWPLKTYPLLGSLAEAFTVSLCINKNFVKPEKFIAIMGGENALDWCAFNILHETNVIFYDVSKDRVGFITQMKYPKEFIHSNGSITSVKDLFGSQVFFSLPVANSSFMNKYLKNKGATDRMLISEEKKSQILSNIETESVLLDLGTHQSFDISGKHLKQYNDHELNHFFYLTIPKNEKELFKLAPAD